MLNFAKEYWEWILPMLFLKLVQGKLQKEQKAIPNLQILFAKVP
jgi:hypothetical protein